eukprot:gene25317-25456_t
MLDVDHLLEQVRFRVRNDLYQNYYTVTVNKYLQSKDMTVRCQCPYNLGEICRHEVAALFQLNDILQSGFFENANITYDQKHTVVRMRQVNRQMLQLFTAAESLEKAEKAALFLHVLRVFGASHFLSMQNWDMQKNKLLEQYGYSLKDDLKG